jgi:GAF domain-containing protein
METKHNNARRYILYGVILGLVFPVAATIIDLATQNLALTLENAWRVQVHTPLHWLTDLVPIFLGLFAGLAGRREDHLAQANEKLGREIQERTAAIRDLGALRADLEKETEAQSLELTRRSKFLEATTDISRAATSILEPEQLMQTVVDTIQHHLSLHLAALFLVDDTFEWAVLQAASGDTGRQMLASGHRVRIGEGTVGWSITNRRPRMASWSETGGAPVDSYKLPDAGSEAVLPLRSRGTVLGALAVQATQPDAFDPAFVGLLQTMADHLAVALDNARLSVQNRAATEAARRAQAELSGRSWARYLQTQRSLAFRSDANGVRRLAGGEVLRAGTDGGRDSQDGDPLAVPITIRGHTIGRLDTYKPAADGPWTQEELQMVQQVVEQLGLALEDARLYESAQRRAQREQLVAAISDKIRAAPDIDGILRITVQEIRRALGVSYGAIRLGTETHLRPAGQGDIAPGPLTGDGPHNTELNSDHDE